MAIIPTISWGFHDIGMPYMPSNDPIKRIPPPRHLEMNLVPSCTYRRNNEGLKKDPQSCMLYIARYVMKMVTSLKNVQP